MTRIDLARASDVGGQTIHSTCRGRLTLESGVAISTSDQTAKTTLYFTPYQGNQVGTYSGSAWTVSSFTEKSITLATLTAGLPYDVFIVDGTLALELLAWTNATTRATALATQDGVLCKTGALTRRYLGTICIAATGQSEDSVLKRLVWNYHNRVRRPLLRLETTGSWTYNSNTYHQANASAANQVALVVGVAEEPLDLRVDSITVQHGTIATGGSIAIGEDSTTTPATGSTIGIGLVQVTGQFGPVLPACLIKTPAIGYHFYAWLESVASGTGTFYSDDGASPAKRRGGLIGAFAG